MNSILITGGAGFVGSSLAILFREGFPKAKITVFDNLHRRGSELNLSRLQAAGITFVHGDIRVPSDFEALSKEKFDLFIEGSAEPSVLSGHQGDSPLFCLETNLFGTAHCLEFARKNCGSLLFLSTSRVYSIPELQWIPLEATETRFTHKSSGKQRGVSEKGISEDFSTSNYRSFYGATKLASELLLQEYAHAFGLKCLVNRCSVITGPWQWGKVDQGVFTLWLAKHYFKGALQYTGFEGKGLQVRDLLHPRDLFFLILKQIENTQKWDGQVYNVGGGLTQSVSLRELTKICEEITGNQIEIGSNLKTSPVDIPYFVTDSSLVEKTYSWKPSVSVPEIMKEIHTWLKQHESSLKPIFGETK
ncbi:MAG: NAD-dependent epimerase/dehydratase family protein [Bacteriovoracia bacterium]